MTEYSISINRPRKLQRASVAALFFLHGLCFSSWGSRIPGIQQTLGLSEAELGVILFALPVGQMLSLPLAGWLVPKAGSRLIAMITLLVYGATLVTLGMATSVFQLVAGLFVFGLASNMVNIAVNTQAVGVEELYQKTIMASFHGLWSLAGFTGAAIGTFMIGMDINPFYHFLMVLLIVITGVALSSKHTLRQDPSSDPDQPIFAMPDKSLLILGVIAFCSMVCEGAMFDWSGVYFRKVIAVENAWIGVGYTAFMSTMAGGRFVADWLTTRVGLKRILQISGVLIATGLMIAVFFPYIITATIGFLLVGAGVSSVVPLVYSLAGKSKTMSPSVALAAVSTIGFVGFLLGPPIIGLVAEATSLRISFSIIAAMGLCVALVASRSKRL
jgi:MFS family permease